MKIVKSTISLVIFIRLVVSQRSSETVTELPLDNLISLFHPSPTIVPPQEEQLLNQSQFLKRSGKQDVILDHETFQVLTLNWHNGGRNEQDKNPTKEKGQYRNGNYNEYGTSQKQVEQSPLGETNTSSSSEPNLLTSFERRRIRSVAKLRQRHRTTRRKKRALTSIQKKYWWPFNRNKEIIVTKSLTTKNTKSSRTGGEGWSSCEGRCSCHHGKCHHDHNHDSHSNGPGISYVHHIHHNQQQQLLSNLEGGGIGRANIPRHQGAHHPDPHHHPGPRHSSAEEIAHEKRELRLIQEKIRLKEEIHRLREEQRFEEGVKEIHHHHGPTLLQGRRRPPPHSHDTSSSEEDEDELDKKLKLVEAEKKVAKVHLLASLLSQMGAGGLVTDLLHHGISRIPNSFSAGFPGSYFSVGPNSGGYGGGGNRDRPSGGSNQNRQPTNNPASASPGQSAGSGGGPMSVRPTQSSAPAMSPNMMMTGMGAPMTAMNAAMMGMNTAGMGAMNAAGMMMAPVSAAPVMTPIMTPAVQPAAPAPAINPAVQLAAQILLEDALNEEEAAKSEESGSDEEDSENDIGDRKTFSPARSQSLPSYEKEDRRQNYYRHSPKKQSELGSKTSTRRNHKQAEDEDEDDERENFSGLSDNDDSLEELLDGLR